MRSHLLPPVHRIHNHMQFLVSELTFKCWICIPALLSEFVSNFMTCFQGRFLSSLTTQSPAINVVSRRLLVNPLHFLYYFGLLYLSKLLSTCSCLSMSGFCLQFQQTPWAGCMWWWGWGNRMFWLENEIFSG